MWFHVDISHIISFCITAIFSIIHYSELLPSPPHKVLIKDWYSDYRICCYQTCFRQTDIFLLNVYAPLLRIFIVLTTLVIVFIMFQHCPRLTGI